MDSTVTFEIPAGYEHVVYNPPGEHLYADIQRFLSDLCRKRHIDPTVLLLGERIFSTFVWYIAESTNIYIRPESSTSIDEAQRQSTHHLLNETTGTVIRLQREYRLEPNGMMFLYQPETGITNE